MFILKRYNVIKLLRVLACILVVRGHYFHVFELPEIVGAGVLTGAGPVVIFFVISGFLNWNSFNACPDKRTYYLKRSIRLIPAYYIILFLCIVVESICGIGIHEKVGILGWCRYFSFMNMIIPSHNFNIFNNIFGFWTMGCFPLFYLLVPVFFQFIKNVNRVFFLLFFGLAVNFVSRIFIFRLFDNFNFDDANSFSNISPFGTLYLFLFGMAVAYAKRYNEEVKVTFIIGIIMLLMISMEKSGYVLWGCATAFICMMPNATFLGPRVPDIISRVINGILNYCDINSFNIYLVHSLVATTVKTLTGSNGYKECIISLVVSLIMAELVRRLTDAISYPLKHLCKV